MVCGIIMLIFGILALVQGKFMLTRTKVVKGGPVIAIGILLIAPLPLGIIAGMILGSMMLVHGDAASLARFERIATPIGIAIPVLCLLGALVIAAVYAQPVERRPVQYDDDGYDRRRRPAPPPPHDPQRGPYEGDSPRRPPDDRYRPE